MKLALGAALIGSSVLFASASGHADIVLDQNYSNLQLGVSFVPIAGGPYDPTSTNPNPNDYEFIQIFTAGISGTFAGLRFYGPSISSVSDYPSTASIGVQLYRGLLELTDGGWDFTQAALLGATAVTLDQLPPSANFSAGVYSDFSSQQIPITAGEKLAFELFTNNPNIQFTIDEVGYPQILSQILGIVEELAVAHELVLVVLQMHCSKPMWKYPPQFRSHPAYLC
jgi:hypothetical protein